MEMERKISAEEATILSCERPKVNHYNAQTERFLLNDILIKFGPSMHSMVHI